MTTVHHVNTAPPGALYIGRAMPGRFAASKWANPHKLTRDTPEARRDALRAYLGTLHSTGKFYHVAELRGLALACWCKPSLCHGDVLADLANRCSMHGSTCATCGDKRKASLVIAAGNRIKQRAQCVKCRAIEWRDAGLLETYEKEKILI